MTNEKKSEKSPAAIAFTERLLKACDDNATVPAYGVGRNKVIAEKIGVSQEAVRKWFSAESMPKQLKMKALADYLGVDRVWLQLGEKPELSRDARKLAAKVLEAAVMHTAATIVTRGGICAFPQEGDPRGAYVDIYAILNGIRYDIHVCSGREISDNTYELVVPNQCQDIQCVGYVPSKIRRFDLIDLHPALVEKHKNRRADDYIIHMTRSESGYFSDDDMWPEFKPAGGL